MDADQLDLKITGYVVTPARVLEDGTIGVRSEIVAGLGPAAPSRDGRIRLDEELAPGPRP